MGLFLEDLGLSRIPLVRFVLAPADVCLEGSTQPLFLLLQCTSRQAFLGTAVKCNFGSTFIESTFATAEACLGFSLPDLVVRILESQMYIHCLWCFAQEAYVARRKVIVT